MRSTKIKDKEPSIISPPNGVAVGNISAKAVTKSEILNTPITLDGQLRQIASEGSAKSQAQPISTVASIKDRAEQAVVKTLNKLASDPNQQGGGIKSMVAALPAIGPSIAYADAWKLWHQGKANGDEKTMQDARAKCLVAIGYAGLDILLFGTKAIHMVAKLAGAVVVSKNLVAPLLKLQAVRVLSLNKKGQINSIIQSLANREPAKSVAEFLLQQVEPDTSKLA